VHELISEPYRDVRAGHLLQVSLDVDEGLDLRVTTVNREHECSTSTALRDLTASIAETLHEDTDAVSGSCRVGRGLTLRTDGGDIESDSTAPLHDLNLLLISEEYASVAIVGLIDYKAVRQRLKLVIIPDSRHWRTLRYNLSELIEETKDLVFAHWVWILCLYPGKLSSKTKMHLSRSLLKLISLFIMQSVFSKNIAGEVVAAKILK
jgi:hypothetical protein